MQNQLDGFYSAVGAEQTMTLATAADGRVTMRAVSPALCGGDILFFTVPFSAKYGQLRANPRCCCAVGGFFVEAEAEFLGGCMSAGNGSLRELYRGKFPGAFAPGDPFGGENAEFILLHPRRLSGWTMENGVPTAPFALDI